MTSDSRCTPSSSSSWLASARFPTWASNEFVPASICHDDGTEPLDLRIQPILNYSHDTLLPAGNHKVISPNVSLVFNTCCLVVTPCPLPSIPYIIWPYLTSFDDYLGFSFHPQSPDVFQYHQVQHLCYSLAFHQWTFHHPKQSLPIKSCTTQYICNINNSVYIYSPKTPWHPSKHADVNTIPGWIHQLINSFSQC